MKIKDIVLEAGSDNIFQRYRELGQEPMKLAGHLAGKIFGSNDTDKGVSQEKSKVSVPDDGDTKVILNKLLANQDLDEKDKESLRAFKNSNDDAETNAVLDKGLRGARLDSRDMQVVKNLTYQL